MKKIFLFAIAAVTMATGCAKLQEIINPNNQTEIDENAPVEIKFTTNVAGVETKVRTKAAGALTGLTADQTLYIYGLNKKTPGSREIINEPANVTVSAGATAAGLSWVEPGRAFFYNGTTDHYEFYGYYVDDAANAEPTGDYKLDVTITGQQDILYAKADPSTVTVDGGTYVDNTVPGIEVGGKTYPLYSASSARIGVKPNLEFKHALSQFTFAVRNQGTKPVTLKKVELLTPDKAEFVVAGDNQGVTVGGNPVNANLVLPMSEKTLNKSADYTSLEKSIMAFPGQEYKVVLYLHQDGMSINELRTVTIPVKIKNDLGTEVPAAEGKSYKVSITIYSLEVIELTATLAQWVPGEAVNLDSETDGGAGSEGTVELVTIPTATQLATTTTSRTYVVTIPDATETEKFTSVEVALTTTASTTDATEWKTVGGTKATDYQVTFDELSTDTYYFHLRYKKSTFADATWTEAAAYTTIDAVESKPFAITKAWFVKDEATYNELPEGYRTAKGGWDKYLSDAERNDDNFTPLPWIAVTCSAGTNLTIDVYSGEGETKTKLGNTLNGYTKGGLFTIAAGELGEGITFTYGKYTLVVNGATVVVEYAAPTSSEEELS